jgi:hypothetical protein
LDSHARNSSMGIRAPVWKACGKTSEIRLHSTTRASRPAGTMLGYPANAHR